MAPYAYISNSDSKNFSNLNKSDEAISPFDKTIEINPQDSAAWYDKADTPNRLNKFDEAITAYKKIEIT